jgi:hypothetical protein
MEYQSLKKALLFFALYFICSFAYAQPIVGADRINKDNYTIIRTPVGNAIMCDTSYIATRYYVSTIGGGSVTSVATGLGLTGGTITTTGTLSLDTASSVVLSRQRAANTYQPIGSYLTSVDTSNIANFYVKVRGLFSANTPAVYSSGIISIDTSTSGTGLVNKTRLTNQLTGYQATLVSGTNIKTVNSNSLVGSGNVSVGDLISTNNLSDVANAKTARGNLGIKTIILTADDPGVTGTTSQEITDGTTAWNWSIGSNESYTFEFWILLTTTGTSGVRANITVPAGASLAFTDVANNNSATSVAASTVTASNTNTGALVSFTATANGFMWVKGSVINSSTAGTVSIRYSDANAAQTATAKKGGFLKIEKL